MEATPVWLELAAWAELGLEVRQAARQVRMVWLLPAVAMAAMAGLVLVRQRLVWMAAPAALVEMVGLLEMAGRVATAATARLARTEVLEQMAKRAASVVMAELEVAGDPFQEMAARVVMPVKAARAERAVMELQEPMV